MSPSVSTSARRTPPKELAYLLDEAPIDGNKRQEEFEEICSP
jgi:hypothetical protein